MAWKSINIQQVSCHTDSLYNYNTSCEVIITVVYEWQNHEGLYKCTVDVLYMYMYYIVKQIDSPVTMEVLQLDVIRSC